MATENDIASGAVSKSLGEWQHHIAEHFSNLANSRKGKNTPVFALEHNLSITQLEDLKSKLRKQLNDQGVNRSYWLPLVIYATELGYEYDGEEYWQSFEDSTPSWSNHHREDLRWAFHEFQKKYNGVKPTGKWADHFSIIALPITHAIIPRDLQVHLAKVLFTTRYKFSGSHRDPRLMGSVLSANAYAIHSTRFQNFLEQEELVGRIALALIGDDTSDTSSELIYKSTLGRIVTDLEKKSNAREWIHVTRREVKANMLGTKKEDILYDTENYNSTNPSKRPPTRPIIYLQRSDPNKWIGILEIPNLNPALVSKDLSSLFRNTRFRLSGVKSNWLPTESLLTGNFRRQLSEWPNIGPILKFEKSHELLDQFEKSECNLSQLFPIVFKIDAIGNAKEVLTKSIRPGFKYILGYPTETQIPKELTIRIDIECPGIFGTEIDVPENPVASDIDLYKRLGLSLVKTIKVFPSGIPARLWDGEGFSEWLTTEHPCFCIIQDHDVGEYQVSIGNLVLSVNPKQSGAPTFIKLPHLPVGHHILKIQSKNVDSEILLEGSVTLNVREPIAWVPSATMNGGFSAFLEPLDSNLDNLLAGRTDIKIYGPTDRLVSIQLDLYAAHELLDSIGPKVFKLPIDFQELRDYCTGALKNPNIEVAAQLKAIISAEELGSQDIYFQRSLDPIRWYYKSIGNVPFLRLIDEMDSAETLEVTTFSMDDPTVAKKLSSNEWNQLKSIKDVKGLIRARKGKQDKSIIVSYLSTTHSFDAFRIAPSIPQLTGDRIVSFCKWLGHARMWHNARCVNFVAHIHRQKVLDKFMDKILTTLCGDNWANEETNFINSSNFQLSLIHLSSRVGDRSIANVMSHRILNTNAHDVRPDKEKAWFIDAIVRCKIHNETSLPFFAIKLASNPLIIEEHFKGDFTKNLNNIFRNKTLMRAARFYSLGLSKLIDPERQEIQTMPIGLKW